MTGAAEEKAVAGDEGKGELIVEILLDVSCNFNE